jgi:hypothetical protein
MLKAQFIDIIREPRHLDSAQVAELESIVKEYPFFESAHLLYAKGLHQYNALNYSRQLRKTAIVANSRAVLYELLHPKEAAVLQQPIAKVPETVVEPVAELVKPEEPVVEPEKKPEELSPDVTVLSRNPVTITSDEIKVVYITTVPKTPEVVPEKEEKVIAKEEPVIPVIEKTVEVPQTEEPLLAKESASGDEIAIIQSIENETEAPAKLSGEERLNRSIGQEISRGIIQSYVETELIKTPELQKEEAAKPLSFTDWLNRVKTEAGTISKTEVKPPETTKKSVPKEEKQPKTEKKPSNLEQNKNIIDKIIDSDPGRIKLGANKFFTPASDAKQSLLENEHLVTETLAKIYALQGNISKAIRAYEILSLKFPQKSVYFASLIEKLKK